MKTVSGDGVPSGAFGALPGVVAAVSGVLAAAESEVLGSEAASVSATTFFFGFLVFFFLGAGVDLGGLGFIDLSSWTPLSPLAAKAEVSPAAAVVSTDRSPFATAAACLAAFPFDEQLFWLYSPRFSSTFPPL